jgi:hypothetical protein
MILIGGVGVPLDKLTKSARHISAFLPGRYAMRAIESCLTGSGLGKGMYNLIALTLTGAAACLAGVKLFRWENDQKPRLMTFAWAGIAVLAWLGVGVIAECLGLPLNLKYGR